MFTNPYREMCVNILEKLLPRRAVQDSTLLQAYATFHMMKEVTLSGANYAEIYRAASRKSFRPVAGNKIVVKRRVYVLTDELRTDYQQCVEQAAAWSKYVIPAYSF